VDPKRKPVGAIIGCPKISGVRVVVGFNIRARTIDMRRVPMKKGVEVKD
jgi:hypothetical protein